MADVNITSPALVGFNSSITPADDLGVTVTATSTATVPATRNDERGPWQRCLDCVDRYTTHDWKPFGQRLGIAVFGVTLYKGLEYYESGTIVFGVGCFINIISGGSQTILKLIHASTTAALAQNERNG